MIFYSLDIWKSLAFRAVKHMHELLALLSNFKFYLLSPPGGRPFLFLFLAMGNL